MIAREPPVHTRLRTLVNRAFVSRQIERLRPRVAALAQRLIDGFEGDAIGRSDRRLLHADPASRSSPSFSACRWRRGRGSSTGRTGWSRCTRRAATARSRTRRSRRRRNSSRSCEAMSPSGARHPRDDLISHLIAAEAAGEKLSEDELIAGTIQLLNAGHEATVHSIGNAVKAILESDESPAALFSSDESTAAVWRRRSASTRRCTSSTATRWSRSRSRASGSGRARRSACSSPPPTAIRRAGTTPDRFDPSRPLLAEHRLRRRHPFLHRRAARAARNAGGAADPFRSGCRNLRLAAPPRYRNAWHFHGLERFRSRGEGRAHRSKWSARAAVNERDQPSMMFSFCS